MPANLEESIHWALLKNGPMDQFELLEALSRDATLGFVPLGTSFLEAKIKNCLELMMQAPNPNLYFGLNGKIKVSKRFKLKDMKAATGLPYFQPWLQIGSGSESVYAIFSTSLMDTYCRAGLDRYPIKVGRTSRNLEQRLQELQTGSHLDLRIGIQILTNHSRELEAEIHRALNRMRVTSRNLSSEWFYSNMTEIRNIYQNQDFSSQPSRLELSRAH